jgi:hypothetical protein
MTNQWPYDPLLTAICLSALGKPYDLASDGEDSTNCIIFVRDAMAALFPMDDFSDPVFLLAGEPVGSFAHLEAYVGEGVAAFGPGWDTHSSPTTVVQGDDYIWQGWRASGTGHCGFLRVPPPGPWADTSLQRIDARRSTDWMVATTMEKLVKEYAEFRLVRIRRVGE